MYTLVSYNISLVMTICPSRRGKAHVTHFRILHPRNISGTAKVRDFKFRVHYKLATKSISLVMTDYSPSGRSKGHVTYFYILGPRPYLWSG